MFRVTDWGRPSRVSHLGLKRADHYFLIVRVWGRFVVHGAMMDMMLSTVVRAPELPQSTRLIGQI